MFPDEVLRKTAYWASYFSRDWLSDFPIRIHSSSIAADGSPEWHPDFEKWLTSDRRPPPRERFQKEQRLRTTKVMRRLRSMSVREYEVLYRVLVLREPVEETTRWLNERAVRNNIPLPRDREVHYTNKDTLAILIAGIDFAREHW